MKSDATIAQVGAIECSFRLCSRQFAGGANHHRVLAKLCFGVFLVTSVSVSAYASHKKSPKAAFEMNEVILKAPPEYAEPYQPIIEFRARSGVPGHAFMLFGRKLNDGTTIFYGGAGFYPKGEPGGFAWVKNVVYGSGVVAYRFEDATESMPVVFRVNITLQQEVLVLSDVSLFGSRYSLPWQNCVSLMDNVARDIGLRSGMRGDLWDRMSVSQHFPFNYVVSLRALNNADTPLRYWEQHVRELQKLDEAARAKADSDEKRNRGNQSGPAQNGRQAVGYGPGPGGGYPQSGTAPSPGAFPGPITVTKPPRMTPVQPQGPKPGPAFPFAGSRPPPPRDDSSDKRPQTSVPIGPRR